MYHTTAGCYSKNSKVCMENQCYCLIVNLTKGIKIRCSKIIYKNNIRTQIINYIEVLCIVETKGKCHMVSIPPNDLEITPWHPILSKTGSWITPASLCTAFVTRSRVYNIVLAEKEWIPFINGIPCASYGNGIKEMDIRHPYFTKKILVDLKNIVGWSRGWISLKQENWRRDQMYMISSIVL